MEAVKKKREGHIAGVLWLLWRLVGPFKSPVDPGARCGCFLVGFKWAGGRGVSGAH